jgi:hypothetical protein
VSPSRYADHFDISDHARPLHCGTTHIQVHLYRSSDLGRNPDPKLDPASGFAHIQHHAQHIRPARQNPHHGSSLPGESSARAPLRQLGRPTSRALLCDMKQSHGFPLWLYRWTFIISPGPGPRICSKVLGKSRQSSVCRRSYEKLEEPKFSGRTGVPLVSHLRPGKRKPAPQTRLSPDPSGRPGSPRTGGYPLGGPWDESPQPTPRCGPHIGT